MDSNLLLFDAPSGSSAQRTEKQNNPFDECEWIANHNTEVDPFDIVAQKINNFDRSKTNNLLINMNNSCEIKNNSNLSNFSLNTSAERCNNPITPRSVKICHKLSKSGVTPSPSSLKRERISSDSGVLRVTQGKNLIEKLREETKSLDNETLISVTKKRHEIVCPSFTEKDTSCEDLNSTTPNWVDLEQDDVSDIETLTIPFLKKREENEATTVPNIGNGSDRPHGSGSSGDHHTKLEMHTILENIKQSNVYDEKQLFLNNLEASIAEFMIRFNVTKNCDKIKTVLKTLVELLEEKNVPEENLSNSQMMKRHETFDVPEIQIEPIQEDLRVEALDVTTIVPVTTPLKVSGAAKKTSRASLNVSARESISHRSSLTTPISKVRSSLSHQLSASKKENCSPSVARRSLYATPSKIIKPIAETSTARLRLRSKTQTLSTSGPVKALEPARGLVIPPKIVIRSGAEHKPAISGSSTPIASKRLSTSRISSTPASTPIGKGISKITPSRLSKLHTPSRIRKTLSDFNVS